MGSLYTVLKAGIRQRTSEGGFSKPSVGESISVSDLAAPRLIAKGWIERRSGGGGEGGGGEGGERKKKKRRWQLSARDEVVEQTPEPEAPEEPKAEATEDKAAVTKEEE